MAPAARSHTAPDALNLLSMTLLRRGDPIGARRLLDEACAVEAELGLRFCESMTFGSLATVEYAEKDYAASRLLEQSCAIWRGIDHR